MYDESLKVMETCLREICKEDIGKKVEVPRKVLNKQKPEV